MIPLNFRELAKKFIQKLTDVPEQQLEAFLDEIELKKYESKSYFTKIGDAHDHVGLVIRGVFRVYYLSPDGEIHIRNFCNEGKLLGSYGTILTKQPAHVTIEALEDSLVLQFSFSAISRQYGKHSGWERLGRRVAEDHYISRERREYYLLSLDAASRLACFRNDFPGLENRITKANVASYIGVKPETLSRLLKRI
ncbi:MAG: Crp/Fnr family transcriptional regulator [Bdellovibrionales bacterium]|nr:Crp/Fnr family transcriptional regulator [Bdellovibrionales bacterium]